jgi:hypothetical protein
MQLEQAEKSSHDVFAQLTMKIMDGWMVLARSKSFWRVFSLSPLLQGRKQAIAWKAPVWL